MERRNTLQPCNVAYSVEVHVANTLFTRCSKHEADIKQTYSKYIVHYERSKFASRVLDVCFVFASSCKQGITIGL